MSTTMTFTPQHPSPLARTISPFKDPRPPPCTPGKTAQIWDEYERHAVENAKRRETTPTSAQRHAQSPRLSSGTVYEIIKSYDPHSSPAVPSIRGSPRSDFSFPSQQHQRVPAAEPTTVAICKTCKGAIRSTPGICEACKKTIVLSSPSGQATPPLTPATPSFQPSDVHRPAHPPCSGTSSPTSGSPKRRPHHGSSSKNQLFDPPIRLSSLRPPPPLQTTPRTSLDTSLSRPRKASLPDPADMLPRLQAPRRPPAQHPPSHPATPITPPSTSHARTYSNLTSPWATARPCSLANITTPPAPTAGAYHYNQHYHSQSQSARHSSATPSELSSLRPSTSTSPPSVWGASHSLQNTMSAWEESDSEDEEKRGLVKYWRGRRWRGSRGSLGGQGQGQSQGRRGSAGTVEETSASVKARRRGFVRVISCGCDE